MEFFLILLGTTVIFFAISLRHIPAEPPHVAVVTFFGRRLRKIKREGYKLFPFYPVIYNAVLIQITKENYNLQPKIVRSHNLAELEISVSMTWTPNPDYAIEYLNSGAKDGVNNIMEDMISQRLREWASDTGWIEILKAKDEATAMLIRDIAGLKSHLSEKEQEEMIKKIRIGDGVQPIPQLGITLNRLNIGEVKPRGELVRAAELWVKEQREREGEKFEISHVLDLIQQLKKALDISTEQALEIAQTERGKVIKKVQEIKGSLSGETGKMIEQIIDQIWLRKGK